MALPKILETKKIRDSLDTERQGEKRACRRHLKDLQRPMNVLPQT